MKSLWRAAALGLLGLCAACGEKHAETILENAEDNEQFELHVDVRYSSVIVENAWQASDVTDGEPLHSVAAKLEFQIWLLETVTGAFVLAEDDRQLQLEMCGEEYHLGDDVHEDNGNAEYYALQIDNPVLEQCAVEIRFDHGRWRSLRFDLPQWISVSLDDAVASHYDRQQAALEITWPPLQRDAELRVEWTQNRFSCPPVTNCEHAYVQTINAIETSHTLPANVFTADDTPGDLLRVTLGQFRYDLDTVNNGFHWDSDVEFDQRATIEYRWLSPTG